MSKFADIRDGKDRNLEHERGGLVYTCHCGWLDLGHARPDNAARLWRTIDTETGEGRVDGRWYRVTFIEEARKLGIPVSTGRSFAVRKGLSRKDKESVTLGILLDVSNRFESLQDKVPDFISDSGYSAEDFVSNVVGFYRAVRPGVPYIGRCGPVSLAAAQAIWNKFGAVGTLKNRSAAPFIFPCAECNSSPGAPMSGRLPSFLSMIEPALEGELYKPWDVQTALEEQTSPLQLKMNFYVVQPGESLSKIASRVYGNMLLWPLIYDSNRKSLGPNPNIIQPGDRLFIPELKGFSPMQLDDAQRRGRSSSVGPLR